jgi:hypothetical protein
MNQALKLFEAPYREHAHSKQNLSFAQLCANVCFWLRFLSTSRQPLRRPLSGASAWSMESTVTPFAEKEKREHTQFCVSCGTSPTQSRIDDPYILNAG